jgi:hypothetical protein
MTSSGEKKEETFSVFIVPPAFKMSQVIEINVMSDMNYYS